MAPRGHFGLSQGHFVFLKLSTKDGEADDTRALSNNVIGFGKVFPHNVY